MWNQQLGYPSTDEQIKVYVHSQTVLFYQKEDGICGETDGDGDPYVSPDSERHILHMFIHMKSLDLLKSEIEKRLLGKKKKTSRHGRGGKRGNGRCEQRTLYVYTNMAKSVILNN